MSESDHLFAQPQQHVIDFVFNGGVVRVFPGMIERSVPGYPTIVGNVGVLDAQFVQLNNVLYDPGCSLGTVTRSLRHHVRNDGCRVIGVDNSRAMIERCSEYLYTQDAMYRELLPVELIEADILALSLQPTSLVAINFTLQFVAPDQRLGLLRRIRQALLPGGALILSEKPCSADTQEHTLLTDLCIAFKRASGYSKLEIVQKRSALEDIMFPDTPERHRERLLAVGFSRVNQWFQRLNFASMIVLP